MGIFEPWASCTRETILERNASSPVLVTVTVNSPVRFEDPPVTGSPFSFSTGMGSPVIIDSSTDERPERISPSTGTLSPGPTFTVIPMETASIGTRISVPSMIALASLARSVKRFLISLAALSRSDDSINLPEM